MPAIKLQVNDINTKTPRNIVHVVNGVAVQAHNVSDFVCSKVPRFGRCVGCAASVQGH